MDKIKGAFRFLINKLNDLRLLLLPFWKKLWYFSNFNKSRYASIGKAKKMLSWLYTIFISFILFIVAFETNFLWIFGHMPSMKEVRNPKIALITEVYSADKKLMGTFFVEQRTPVDFNEINPKTIEALIATEDVRFYKHHGLDFYALSSALIATIQGKKRGGSTITQQLVKNVYRTRNFNSKGLLGYIPLVRTIIAKLKEWITALKIEFYYSKKEILTMYFNVVDFGNNSFGIKTASEFYFSKNPSKLKVEEGALLVGLLKAPSYYNPKNSITKATERRNVVLSQMAKYSFITEKEKEKLSKKKVKLRVKEIVHEQGIAPYFRTALVKELKDWCDDNDYNVYTDGLKIYTTIDSRLQTHAEQAVEENMAQLQANFEGGFWGHGNWFDYKIALEKRDYQKLNPTPKPKKGQPKPTVPLTPTEIMLLQIVEQSSQYKLLLNQGLSKDSVLALMEVKKPITIYWRGKTKKTNMSAIDSIKYYNQVLKCGLVAIEPKLGHVKAWVGGNHWDYFKYDHVNQAKRQAGSSFKPILYAAALESGMGPCDEFVDKPVSFPTIEDGKEVLWEPRNAERSYTYKPMSLRIAVAKSINTVAAQTTDKIGPNKVVKMAKKLKIDSKLDETLSIGLGTSDVTLLELTNAYTAFANKGKIRKPVLVTRIEDNKGEEIVTFKDKAEQAISEENAYLMTFLLRGSIEEGGGTSRKLYSYGVCEGEIGGKTGTSNNNSDGWFVGVTPQLVAGVWVGCDNRLIHFENANGQGGRTALPIFGRFLQLVYNDKATGIKPGTFEKPSKLEKSIDCYTPYVAKDTTHLDEIDDSDIMDSLSKILDQMQIPVPEEETPEGIIIE
jgi:penicillin-binding protein 1A